MMERKDFRNVTIVGAEVGLFVQPIILNLWGDISGLLLRTLGFIPAPIIVHLGAFIGFTLLAPLALFILSLIAKKIPVAYQFGKFAAVGSSNVFVDVGLLNIASLIFVLDKGTTEFKVFAVATALIATVNSFLWNKSWTFDAKASTEKPLVELLKFYAVTGFSALVNGIVTGLVAVVAGNFGVSEALAQNIGKLGGVLCSFIFNFLGYKFFVFKKST